MIQLILLAIAGVLLNILRKLSELERLKQEFSIRVWIEKNTFRTLFSVTAAIICTYAMREQLTGLDAVLLGFTVDAFIKTKAKAFRQ